jgi:signal transduction histidine kinase
VEQHDNTWRDLVLSLALTTFFIVITPHAVEGEENAQALDALAYVLLAGAGLSFALRGPWPYASYAVALTCTVTYLAIGYGDGPIYIAPFLALVRVVSIAPRRVWIGSALVGVVAIAIVHVVRHGWSEAIVVSTSVWLVAAVAGGEALRARRGQAAALLARAIAAERSAEEQALRRGAEERLRMAQEIHDVVGHSLAVISLQAGVAAHLLETRPEQAREAITAIRSVSSEALDDLRAELGLLRGADGRPPPPAEPAGIADVSGLVASLRQAGVDVELQTEGVDAVPDATSAAAYRIVREALTNVARHAGAGSRAQVRIAAVLDAVEVEVLDDGAGPRSHNGAVEGSGIAGMRERAQAVGGRLETGAGPDGGFRVWASLPARES